MRIRLSEAKRQQNIALISKRLNSLTPNQMGQAISIVFATQIVDDACNNAKTVDEYYQMVNCHVNTIKQALDRTPIISLKRQAVKFSYQKKPVFFNTFEKIKAESRYPSSNTGLAFFSEPPEKSFVERMQDPNFSEDTLVKEILDMDDERKRYLDPPSDSNVGDLKPR